MKKLKVGSMFAGVGGLDLGFHNSGYFETKWAIEWMDQQQSVLRKNLPDAKLYGDVTLVDPNELDEVDGILYGFPCQDVSVSGKRAGMNKETRSGLFYEAIRIITELKPRFALAENVLGLLSSGKREDFGRCLKALAQAGYSATGWVTLDSRHFGVAQRRRRVFLISFQETDRHTLERVFGEIYSLSESVSGSDQTSGQSREHDTSQTEDSTGETIGFPVTGGKWKGCFTEELSPTIRVGSGLGIPSPPAVGFQRSQLRTKGTLEELEISPTLKAQTKSGDSELNVLQSFRLKRYGNSDFIDDNTASTLKKRDHKDSTDLVVSYSPHSHYKWVEDDVSATLQGRQNRGSGHTQLNLYESHPNDSRTKGPLDVSPTITKRWGTGGNNTPIIDHEDLHVRRLTPVECERLQGFPDGWTATGINEQGEEIKISDSMRYQMMGNAVTVNVAQFLAEKLGKILSTQ